MVRGGGQGRWSGAGVRGGVRGGRWTLDVVEALHMTLHIQCMYVCMCVYEKKTKLISSFAVQRYIFCL